MLVRDVCHFFFKTDKFPEDDDEEETERREQAKRKRIRKGRARVKR